MDNLGIYIYWRNNGDAFVCIEGSMALSVPDDACSVK